MKKDYIETVNKMIENGVETGTYIIPVDTINGTNWAIVLSWQDGFVECDTEYKRGECRICGKLAYNCSSLQCDYDFDWYMPRFGNGDIYDTESVIECNGDIKYAWEYWASCWETIRNSDQLTKCMDKEC